MREEILLDRLRHACFENLLEIGCGEGRLTHALSALARRTRAFDISQAALGRASARYPGIEFEQGDMLDVLARP
ncbi:class I SAM-dependent methyltransferase, partial [Streptomyces galilaeus]|uniref:class I SAM-dependent methyltransferase n=1 Tax=Streptomyces galilaeus TaxID=33899 RepID=UPI0038F7D65C